MANTHAQGATQTEATKPPKFHPCKCLIGTRDKCPEETTKAFARGHDAKMSSRIAGLIAAGKMDVNKATTLIVEAGGSELLVSKTVHSAKLRTDKAAAKDLTAKERAAAKVESNKEKAAKAAKAKADRAAKSAAKEQADGEDDDGEDDDDEFDDEDEDEPAVAVGTKGHVKDGDKTYAAVVIKNAADELVARHRVNGKNPDHDLDEFTAA
jgi:hypothetical protein